MNNGDTIKGWIDYRQWEYNPKTIRFKSDLTMDGSRTYSIDDLLQFEVTGSDKYIKAIVSKDMRPVDINYLENARDTTEMDTAFLRVLLQGTVSLYRLEDTKAHFYYKAPGKDYQELIYKVFLNDGKLSRQHSFRDQLRQFFPNSFDLEALPAILLNAEYKENDLVRLVEKINNSIPGGTTAYKVTQVKQPVSFYAGAGIVYSGLTYSGIQRHPANLDYSKNIKPLLAGGVDFHIGRNHQRLFLRFELAWFQLSYEGRNDPDSPDSIYYNLKINNLSPSFSVLYNAINTPGGKLYFGAGIAYNLSGYSKNMMGQRYAASSDFSYSSPFLALEKKWTSMHVKAGYLLNNKIEFAGAFKLGGSFSNFTGLSLDPSLAFLSVNYHF
jgi:hypothetical protein